MTTVREVLLHWQATTFPEHFVDSLCPDLGIDRDLDLDTHRLVVLPAEIAEHFVTLLWIASSDGLVADQFAETIPAPLWITLDRWLESKEAQP